MIKPCVHMHLHSCIYQLSLGGAGCDTVGRGGSGGEGAFPVAECECVEGGSIQESLSAQCQALEALSVQDRCTGAGGACNARPTGRSALAAVACPEGGSFGAS